MKDEKLIKILEEKRESLIQTLSNLKLDIEEIKETVHDLNLLLSDKEISLQEAYGDIRELDEEIKNLKIKTGDKRYTKIFSESGTYNATLNKGEVVSPLEDVATIYVDSIVNKYKTEDNLEEFFNLLAEAIKKRLDK